MPRAFSATPASLRVRTHSSHTSGHPGGFSSPATGQPARGGLQRQALNARRRKRHSSPLQRRPDAPHEGDLLPDTCAPTHSL